MLVPIVTNAQITAAKSDAKWLRLDKVMMNFLS
jgi:hypothetical protein